MSFFNLSCLLLFIELLKKLCECASAVYPLACSIVVFRTVIKVGVSYYSFAPSVSPTFGPTLAPTVLSSPSPTNITVSLYGFNNYQNYYLLLWVASETLSCLNEFLTTYWFYFQPKKNQKTLFVLFFLRGLPAFLSLVGIAGFLSLWKLQQDYYAQTIHLDITFYLTAAFLAVQVLNFYTIGSIIFLVLSTWIWLSFFAGKFNVVLVYIPMLALFAIELVAILLAYTVAIPSVIIGAPLISLILPSAIEDIREFRSLLKKKIGTSTRFAWFSSQDQVRTLITRFDGLCYLLLFLFPLFLGNFVISCWLLWLIRPLSMPTVTAELIKGNKFLGQYYIAMKVLHNVLTIIVPWIKLIALGLLWRLQEALELYTSLQTLQNKYWISFMILQLKKEIIRILKGISQLTAEIRTKITEAEEFCAREEQEIDMMLHLIEEKKRVTEEKISMLVEIIYGHRIRFAQPAAEGEKAGVEDVEESKKSFEVVNNPVSRLIK